MRRAIKRKPDIGLHYKHIVSDFCCYTYHVFKGLQAHSVEPRFIVTNSGHPSHYICMIGHCFQYTWDVGIRILRSEGTTSN